MIELVAQIDSKITACCRFMQPIKNWFVPSMLAAGANRKVALIRIFCEIELRNSGSFSMPPVFSFFCITNFKPHKKLALNI